jgi:hypothetical protein
MKEHPMFSKVGLAPILLTAVVAAALPRAAFAHCDSLDGPVVVDARTAIEKKDLTPVLKWIGPAEEPEVRAAFARTLAVRGLSSEARELADRSFFETVVRVHRAKEGEPYTGLKPAGTDPGPAVRAVDRSLEQGSPDALVRLISERAGDSVRRQFGRVLEAKRHAAESVEAGRAFTKAYAEFAHSVEELYRAAEESEQRTEHDHHQ